MVVSADPGSDDGDAVLVAMIARVQPALRAFLHALVRSPTDVDDVLQETNVVLWQKRGEYDPTRDFLPWACTIARYQALAWMKRHRRDALQVDEALFDSIAMAAAGQLELAEQRIRALRDCLSKLPEHYRQVVDDRYLAGQGVQQIAVAQGRSVDAVSMLLFRARQQLHLCIEAALKLRGAT